MRKITRFFVVMLMFIGAFGINSAQAVQVTIGTGTLSSSYPFTTLWHDGRTQMLFTAAELTAAGAIPGNIQDIAFDVITANTLVMNGFTISMQATSVSTVSAFVETGWNTVYTGNYTVPGTGWQTIAFQTPFTWNGTSNLLIQICYDNTSYTSNSTVRATAAAGMTWGRNADNLVGCTLTGGTAQANRPNIRMNVMASGNAQVTGIVTNALNSQPIIGAKVKIGDSIAITAANGAYTLRVNVGTHTIECSKLGFNTMTSPLIATAGGNHTQNFAMQENTPAPGVVFAALNTGATAANINWGLPTSGYEIIYDDGVFENMTTWATAGNINALKFTPINQYPIQVTGGSVHIGNGTFPAGQTSPKAFEIGVYDDDGNLGYPGTELAKFQVTPTKFGWVEFTLPTPITLTSGNFYIGMIQLGAHPNCAAIAIDETNPSMRSYSRFLSGGAPWVPAGYNDFMIRAKVQGSGGPLDLATSSVQNMYVERTRIHRATHFMNQPKVVGGHEGDAMYKPLDNGDSPESLLGYQVWRLKQGEELTPAVWTSVGTPATNSIVDNSWPSLANGPYLWAVKAKYTGDRWSEAVFSNVIGKGWTSNVTFNITLSSVGAVPSGVSIIMDHVTYDTLYPAITPASGTVNFPNVWKGNYNITVQKFGYQPYTATVNIINDSYTFNIHLLETKWAPYNLFVDDRTLVATWNAPNPQVALLEERWTAGNFTANQWVKNGGNWGISASIGNAAPSAIFNWSPQVTNYNQTLTSKEMTGVGSPALSLKYDIMLDNYGTTYENQMAVEIWDGAAWNRLKNYSSLSGSFDWTSESINLNAYTWDTFKIRFVAYGADTYDINNWNIDNILVLATLADKNMLGYNVYLNDIQIAYTTQTTYTLPASLCVYGQTYTASVDAIYESGASDRDYYTFTAHFLPAPRNLEGVAVQDAAYLTWEVPVMPSDLKVMSVVANTNTPNAHTEYSPVATTYDLTDLTDAIWDVLFTFNGNAAAQPGIETNGTFIYTATWNSGTFSKYQNNGGTWSFVEDFTVPGAANVRDLAYDGTYFYGSAASTTLFKMDFTNKVLVGTIATPGVSSRHIAFDPTANNNLGGFWAGNWSDLFRINMTGATLATATPGLSGMYGSAYDGVSAGGPYLWLFDQGAGAGTPQMLHQMKISTMAMTGVTKSVSTLPGFNAGSGIAGGLCSDNGNLVAGKFALIGSVQQDPNLIFAYEVAASTGGGTGGGTPSNLLGYNIYRDGTLLTFVAKPTLEYYDLYLNPGEFCYDVTAVYDLSAYGFPMGQTAESLEEGTACVDINYGIVLPWMESWNTANFTFNSWNFEPSQGHWRISNAIGNGVPAAEFNWAAPETDYSYSMVGPALNASIFDCAQIWLDFDLKLDDRNQTGNEKLKVEVFYDGTWKKVAEYKNEGSINWAAKHIEISQVAGKALKVRFTAHGANTADMLAWFVDNIHVYPVCTPAAGLVATKQDNKAVLNWNAPECATGPVGVLKMLKQWAGDPATQQNAYYQAYGSAYGVVYDLTAYPDAAISKVDFHHAAWGVNGSWQYKVHIVEWNTYTLIATLGPFTTTGNDKWENGINLGDIMGYGGGLVGIMLEPMSNSSTDAYPCFTADNDGPTGVSVSGVLPDFAGFAPSTIGDFYQNLWITTALDKGKTVAAAKVKTSQATLAAQTRLAATTLYSNVLTANQKEINAPENFVSRGVAGFNIYRDGVKINNTLVTDTTYSDNGLINGNYCYKVTAVHEGDCESPMSNEACISINVGIDNPASQTISIYPNPARTSVNIKATRDIRNISLINFLGQKVYSKDVKGAGQYSINTTTFESGVYFVRFTTADGNVVTERLTIAK